MSRRTSVAAAEEREGRSSMKARIFRLTVTLASLAALAAVLGAPKKW